MNYALHSKDSYKIDHINQYPKGITEVYSNLTARSGKNQNVPTMGVLFVGLSIFLQEYIKDEWDNSFFRRPRSEVVKQYARRVKGILGGDIDYQHIADLHALGYLPVEIKALPEGSFVPYRVPMLTIRNTDPKFAWVTNMLECVISNELWPMITSATTYLAFKKLFISYANLTGVPLSFTDYQGHDFSYRGMFGRHAGAKSGLAVLLAGCKGTDNISAIDLAETYYNVEDELSGEPYTPGVFSGYDDEFDFVSNSVDGDTFEYNGITYEVSGMDDLVERYGTSGRWSLGVDTYKDLVTSGCVRKAREKPVDTKIRTVIGRSLPASEHSVVCAGGSDNEFQTLERLITEVYPNSNFSYVSDSWDFWKVVNEYLPALKDKILSRGGKLVIRPDSGDPVEIICGAPSSFIETVKFFNDDDIWTFAKTCKDGQSFTHKNKTYVIAGMSDAINEYGFDRAHSIFENLQDIVDEGMVIEVKPCKEEHYEQVGLIESLWDIFGGTINEAGYKVLNPKIGAIYGDGITYGKASEILSLLKAKGFASSNIVFGLGSYLFQYVTRDTHGFAIKSTSVTIDGVRTPIQKDPKTDNGTKKSAKGYLMVTEAGGVYSVVEDVTPLQETHGCLKTVYKNGGVVSVPTLEEVRERVNEHLLKSMV